MKGYKGFKSGLVCREKQYAENTVFEEGHAEICKSGMHFCADPFDVLDYYGFVDESGAFNDFAEVESLDEAKTDDGKKFCTKKLKIGSKLSFAGFVKACVDFVIEKTAGNGAQIGSSGYGARIGSSGNDAQIGSSGNGARIGSSGDDAQIGSSGDDARIGSSGDGAQIGSSGDDARIGSSGDDAQIGSSGDDAQIGSSGNGARIGSSGDGARIYCTGIDSIICCAGNRSAVKAKAGCWITLSEWAYSVEKGYLVPICVKTEYVDGERIKADTFYALVDGKFREV